MGNDGYSDWERLELFLERVEKLKNNSLIRDAKLNNVSFSGIGELEQGNWSELRGADDKPINMETVEALVAAFRLIYMEKERTHFEYVYEVVRQALPPSKHYRIQHIITHWQQTLEQDTELVDKDGAYMKLDAALKTWLYGELFHSDKSKREFVKKWSRPLEAECIFMMSILCEHVFWLADFIVQALNEQWLIPSRTSSTPRPTKQEIL